MFGRRVDLCIYIIPEAPDIPGIPATGHPASTAFVKRDRIFRDVREASRIWSQCGIMLFIKSIEFLTGDFFNIEVQNIKDTEHLPIDFTNMLSNNRLGCTNTDIAVYYVPGHVYSDANGTIANFHFEPHSLPDNPVKPTEHSIIMSDSANGNVLAHEVGHALFLRSDGGPCNNFKVLPGRNHPLEVFKLVGWGIDEPDENNRSEHCFHHLLPQNLMHHLAQGQQITEVQCTTALRSQLAKGLVSNFRVDFQKMDVLEVDDGVGDQELESHWTFKVWFFPAGDLSNPVFVGEEHWDKDINPKDYTIGKSIPFSVDLFSDVIRIEVYGYDEDLMYDDELPKIVRDYDSTSNWGNWGGGSVIVGDPLEGPIGGSNKHLKYNLHFQVFSQ